MPFRLMRAARLHLISKKFPATLAIPATADPMLRAGCTQSHLAVQSNGIPNFEFVQITPNDLQRQRYSWRIPRQPRAATNKTRIPLLGPVAIAINGLPFYGPNEAPRHGTADPIRDQILDFCSGHTAGRGDYHFHARPDCLFRKVQGMTGLVVGYAFDGYPILAPYECADAACARIKKVRSSYKFIGGRPQCLGGPINLSRERAILTDATA